jgi:hypothetical protein
MISKTSSDPSEVGLEKVVLLQEAWRGTMRKRIGREIAFADHVTAARLAGLDSERTGADIASPDSHLSLRSISSTLCAISS